MHSVLILTCICCCDYIPPSNILDRWSASIHTKPRHLLYRLFKMPVIQCHRTLCVAFRPLVFYFEMLIILPCKFVLQPVLSYTFGRCIWFNDPPKIMIIPGIHVVYYIMYKCIIDSHTLHNIFWSLYCCLLYKKCLSNEGQTLAN